MKLVFIASLLWAGISVASAQTLNMTAQGFLSMNGSYREGLVHGALATMIILGGGGSYKEPLEAGVRCLDKRKKTLRETATEFATYIDAHEDALDALFPEALLIFMFECQNK